MGVECRYGEGCVMIVYAELAQEVRELVNKGEDIIFALVKVANKYDLDMDQCDILQDAVLG